MKLQPALPSAEDDPVAQRLGDEPRDDDEAEQEAGEAKADRVEPALSGAWRPLENLVGRCSFLGVSVLRGNHPSCLLAQGPHMRRQ